MFKIYRGLTITYKDYTISLYIHVHIHIDEHLETAYIKILTVVLTEVIFFALSTYHINVYKKILFLFSTLTLTLGPIES